MVVCQLQIDISGRNICLSEGNYKGKKFRTQFLADGIFAANLFL